MATHSTIVGRYLRYKVGTNKVVQWLARTAAQVHDLSTHLKCLKTPASASQSYVVTTRELLELAKIIANAIPAPTVSQSVLDVLDEVIRGRREAHQFYLAQAIGEQTEPAIQDRSHIHFIKVLSEVRCILQPLLPKVEPDNTPKPKLDKPVKAPLDHLTNIFDHLEVEEPQNLAQNEAVQKNDAKDKTLAIALKANFEIEDEVGDDSFAIWCFLQDMYEVRTFVRAAWQDYRIGGLTLEVVGVLTETAIGMLQRLHKLFVETHSRFGTWKSMMDFLQLRVCMHNNVAYMYSKDEPDSVRRPRTDLEAPVPDLICVSAQMLLATWMITRDQAALHFNNGKPGEQSFIGFKPRLPFQESVDGWASARPYTDFEAVYLAMLPQILEASLESGPRCKGLCDYVDYLVLRCKPEENQEHASWLVTATAILMDIHEAVGGRNECGVDWVHRVATKIMAIVESCKKPDKYETPFLKISLDGTGAGEAYEGSSRFLEMIRLQSRKDALREEEVGSRHRSQTEFTGVNQLPHLAGNLAYTLKRKFHESATDMANSDGAILSVAHLYRAAVRYGLCRAWPDMDFLISQHSGKKSFVTKPSNKTDAYGGLRSFLLDLGVELMLVIKPVPPPPPDLPSVHKKAKRIDIRSSAFRAALEERAESNEKLSLGRSNFEVLDDVLVALSAQQKGGRSSATNAKACYTPVQSLTQLKTYLIEDEPSMNFDYLGFYQLCASLFQSFAHAGAFKGAHNIDDQAHKATYYLLKTAADAASRKGPLESTPFAIAAEVLQSTIDEKGKTFSRDALNQSSGRIPNSLRPSLPSYKDLSPEKGALMRLIPGGSIGWSQRRIEIYDPRGSTYSCRRLINLKEMRKVVIYELTREIWFCPWLAQKGDQTKTQIADARRILTQPPYDLLAGINHAWSCGEKGVFNSECPRCLELEDELKRQMRLVAMRQKQVEDHKAEFEFRV